METLAFSGDFNILASFTVQVLCGLVGGGFCALLYWQRPISASRLAAGGDQAAAVAQARRRPVPGADHAVRRCGLMSRT